MSVLVAYRDALSFMTHGSARRASLQNKSAAVLSRPALVAKDSSEEQSDAEKLGRIGEETPRGGNTIGRGRIIPDLLAI